MRSAQVPVGRRRRLRIHSKTFSADLQFDARFILPSSAQPAPNLSMRPIPSDYGTLHAAMLAQSLEDADDDEAFGMVTTGTVEVLAAFAKYYSIAESERLLIEATTLCRALKAAPGCRAPMSSLLSERECGDLRAS